MITTANDKNGWPFKNRIPFKNLTHLTIWKPNTFGFRAPTVFILDDRITTLVCFRRQIQESEPWRGNDLGHQEDLSGSHVNHLKNLSNHLSNEERDKLTAAIHGYLLGKKEAASGESSTLLKTQSNFFSDPGSGSGSKVLGKIDVGSSGQGNYGKKINVWDKVNKVRALLKKHFKCRWLL